MTRVQRIERWQRAVRAMDDAEVLAQVVAIEEQRIAALTDEEVLAGLENNDDKENDHG